MFGLGMPELMIILAVSFLVFGGRKLPEIGEGLGKGISSFKRALHSGTANADGNLLPEKKQDA